MLETKQAEEVVTIGDIKHFGVEIDQSDMSKVILTLTKNLYANKIGSFLRETVSNAWDSHVDAGSIDTPVVISIIKSPTDGQLIQVSVRDYGTGISPEKFDNIYRKVGKSDKVTDNTKLGKFGYGKFSPLAVSSVVNITSYVDGTRYEYIMSEDGLNLDMTLIDTAHTDSKNGVDVIVTLPKNKLSSVYNNVKDILPFFKNVYIQEIGFEYPYISNLNNTHIDFFNTFAIVGGLTSDEVHVVSGTVRYPLDLYTLKNYVSENTLPNCENIEKGISLIENNDGINLLFEIGELNVVPSRELLEYDNTTLKAIAEKIGLFYEEAHSLLFGNIVNKELKVSDIISFDSGKFRYVEINRDYDLGFFLSDVNDIVNKPDFKFKTNFGAEISISEINQFRFIFKETKVQSVGERGSERRIKQGDYKNSFLDTIKNTYDGFVIFVDLLDYKTKVKNYIRDCYPQFTLILREDFKDYVLNVGTKLSKNMGKLGEKIHTEILRQLGNIPVITSAYVDADEEYIPKKYVSSPSYSSGNFKYACFDSYGNKRYYTNSFSHSHNLFSEDKVVLVNDTSDVDKLFLNEWENKFGVKFMGVNNKNVYKRLLKSENVVTASEFFEENKKTISSEVVQYITDKSINNFYSQAPKKSVLINELGIKISVLEVGTPNKYYDYTHRRVYEQAISSLKMYGKEKEIKAKYESYVLKACNTVDKFNDYLLGIEEVTDHTKPYLIKMLIDKEVIDENLNLL